MSVSVTMPALGESVTEGTVTRWLKQEGEQVEADEPLLEVSTDKVDTEIPSPASGVLTSIKVAEDETVDVGTELAVIGDAAAQDDVGGSAPAQDDMGGDAADQAVADAAEAEPAEEPSEPAHADPEPAEAEADAEPAEAEPEPEPEPVKAEPEPAEAEPEPAKAAATGGDAGTTVTMPALGESVTEGTVTRWLKQVGEDVATDEPLLEVSTDKVDTEIPSPVAGTLLEIVVAEDETVDVGAVLARIGAAPGGEADAGSSAEADAGSSTEADAESSTEADAESGAAPEPEGTPAPEPQAAARPEPTPEPEASSKPPPQKASPAPEPTAMAGSARTAEQEDSPGAPAPQSGGAPAPQSGGAPAPQSGGAPAPQGGGKTAPQSGGDGAYVTPLVRKLATEHGIDLATLTGTGVGGRIRKQDVLDAAAAPPPEPEPASVAAPAPTTSGARSAAATSGAGSAPAAAVDPAAQALRGKTEKMSRLRSVIARRMVESLQVSAQLTTVVEVDITAIARLRTRVKGEFEAREGVKLSFLPFLALAAVEALKVHPKVNSSVDMEAGTVTYHDSENLGVAVDTERGLLVPVIHGAGDLNLGGIARKIADLADRTRRNKVTPDELAGGTFTLTNTGSRGALFDTPIINQPQSAILGTGTVVKRPVVVSDPDLGEVIAVRSMIYLALSYDHRIVDGADAARFLVTMKDRLEAGDFEAALGLR